MLDVKGHLDSLLELISKGYKTIVIEQLGDLFHSSQMWSSQTLKGTLLDEVNMVQAVEDAKQFFDVLVTAALQNSTTLHIKQMAGNHSGNMKYMFMEYLKAKYPQAVIKNNIQFRDAYLLDNVGIMLAHGDLAPKNLPMLFANEFGGYLVAGIAGVSIMSSEDFKREFEEDVDLHKHIADLEAKLSKVMTDLELLSAKSSKQSESRISSGLFKANAVGKVINV